MNEILTLVQKTKYKGHENKHLVRFQELMDIANYIHLRLQVTGDTPECNRDGTMAILDMKIRQENNNIDFETYTVIQHTHYAKPMANKQVIKKCCLQL